MSDFDCDKIRNICILAHVDHGKTTLADHLIASASDGLLHPKLAGRLRFMDYLDEEQRRAITMKSSSIALRYKDYSINLIDSPGHMDFCSEVSTAARLSDGALILVDAVEGVHIQTHAVLRQSWIEKLTPCLVLNKIDRLICELRLSPMEAYVKLLNLIHDVNGIVGAYKSRKYLSDVDSFLERPSCEMENDEFMDADLEDTFQPQKGNVAFVCSLDGWGFRIRDFAEFYASKLGASIGALEKGLWGAWYYSAKTKLIVGKRGAVGFKDRPMFVQFVLDPLWRVYQASPECGGDKGILEKLIKSFNLSIPPRELQNKDPKLVLQAVMSRWLPLSETILSMVVKFMPNPSDAQSFRISRLLPKRDILIDAASSSVLDEAEMVRKSVESCDSSPNAPLVAFVSKMFAIPMKMLPKSCTHLCSLNGEDGDEESGECFLAFARVFSGIISSGQRVFVLSELYDPVLPKNVQEAELQSLYLMMGQGLVPVGSVKAGNVVAIRGLGQNILKSATLSSTKNCWPFSSLSFQVSPTMRVSIEPSDPSDLSALVKGLTLLNRADPLVEVTVSSKGENVLAAAGEVHLERCIKDLKERFAKVSLEVSPPLVSFKETIEGGEPGSLYSLKMFLYGTDYIEKITPNGRCTVRVHVMKLPPALTKVLDENSELLGDIISVSSDNAGNRSSVEALKKKILDALGIEFFPETDKEQAKHIWEQILKRIWALGPRPLGSNILLVPDTSGIDTLGSLIIEPFPRISQRLGFLNESTSPSSMSEEADMADTLGTSIESGFQMATSAGPLCDEPVWGLAFLVEAYLDDAQTHRDYGAFAGQVMGLVKDACRAAMVQKKPRLVEAMYFCELKTPTQYLRPMYAVLSRRRAQVLMEEKEVSDSLFTVKSYVPVAEGFGFADELRRETAGGSSALLVFSHWRVLQEDPFFAPKTAEEIEEFGDGSSVLHNTPRKLIDGVRRRKGLPVEEKVVQYASKQRTLSRKV